MKLEIHYEDRDIERIKFFLNERSTISFVEDRYKRNVSLDFIPQFSQDKFWYILIQCLLSSQQKSGPESPINKFIKTRPFPLSLVVCREAKELQQLVDSKFEEYQGIRFKQNISKYLVKNFYWLENGGWQIIQDIADRLKKQRTRPPLSEHKEIERKCANETADFLLGIGPKQSRNLWQTIGYFRYEIPIDSRIVKWLKYDIKFPIPFSAKALQDQDYYHFICDRIQELCIECKVLPCILDATVFSREEFM